MMKNLFKRLKSFSLIAPLMVSCGGNHVSNEGNHDTSNDIDTNELPPISEVYSEDMSEESTPVIPDYDRSYSFETFQNEDKTWGYNILDDSSMFIHQVNIPGIPGKKGFNSEEKAIKTAELVVFKLYNGYFPPSISKNELDSLKVLD